MVKIGIVETVGMEEPFFFCKLISENQIPSAARGGSFRHVFAP